MPKHLIPGKLEEAMNNAPRYKKSTVKPELVPSVAPDPHSFERRLLDDILGGGSGPRGVSSVSEFEIAPGPAAADPDPDLVSKMASRLNALERSTRKMREEMVAKDKALLELQRKNADLKQAAAEAGGGGDVSVEHLRGMRRLRRQIHEMESFLSDYGLVWVGSADEDDDEDDTSRETDDASLASASAPSGVFKSAVPAGLPTATEAPASLVPDFDLFMRRVGELNTVVEADRMRMVRDGNKARFELPPSEPVVMYRNGLMVRSGPFRPFSAPSAQQFVRDVIDGFFPEEFKQRYPDGVPLDVRDRRNENFRDPADATGADAAAFRGEGHMLGRKVRTLAEMGESNLELGFGSEQLLERLPASTIHNGRVIDIRADVKKRLNTNQPGASVVVADTPALRALKKQPQQPQLATPLASSSAEAPAATSASAVAAVADSGAEHTHSKITSLQVRADGGNGVAPQRLLLKMRFDDTVGELRHEIDKARGGDCYAYEIRTAFPNRLYADATQTLEDAGLTPNATLILQRM